MRRPYNELPGFDSLLLEESYVLSIDASHDVIFSLDAVLLPGHPNYEVPRNGEQYCFLPLNLAFPNVRNINWINYQMKPIFDATKEIDYGNIDYFFEEDGSYRLGGDWGDLQINSSLPIIEK